MIEEPVEAVDRNVPIDLFEGVECAQDRLVIGRAQSSGPLIHGEDAHNLFKIAFHFRRHVGPRLTENLRNPSRRGPTSRRLCLAEIVRALLVFRGLRPVEEIVFLARWFLREQIVGDADGKLAFSGEFLDNCVVLWIEVQTTAFDPPLDLRELNCSCVS
jgi:hypothetical protein